MAPTVPAETVSLYAHAALHVKISYDNVDDVGVLEGSIKADPSLSDDVRGLEWVALKQKPLPELRDSITFETNKIANARRIAEVVAPATLAIQAYASKTLTMFQDRVTDLAAPTEYEADVASLQEKARFFIKVLNVQALKSRILKCLRLLRLLGASAADVYAALEDAYKTGPRLDPRAVQRTHAKVFADIKDDELLRKVPALTPQEVEDTLDALAKELKTEFQSVVLKDIFALLANPKPSAAGPAARQRAVADGQDFHHAGGDDSYVTQRQLAAALKHYLARVDQAANDLRRIDRVVTDEKGVLRRTLAIVSTLARTLNDPNLVAPTDDATEYWRAQPRPPPAHDHDTNMRLMRAHDLLTQEGGPCPQLPGTVRKMADDAARRFHAANSVRHSDHQGGRRGGGGGGGKRSRGGRGGYYSGPSYEDDMPFHGPGYDYPPAGDAGASHY